MCEKELDGRIAATIGSTSTLELQYISNSEPGEDKPNHDDSTSNDDDDSFDPSFDLDSEGAQEKMDEFFSHLTNVSRPRGVTPEQFFQDMAHLTRRHQEDY